MMLLWVLLSVGIGLSDQTEYQYGSRYSLKMPKSAMSLEFTPMYNSSHTAILWKRDDPQVNEASRGRLKGQHWVMDKVTQEDNGDYTVKGKGGQVLFTKIVEVVERHESHEVVAGENLRFSFNLDFATCHLMFFSEETNGMYEIIRGGRILDPFFRGRLRVPPSSFPPYEVLVENLRSMDSGFFELRDQNYHRALVVNVSVTVRSPLSSYFGSAVGVVLAVLFCRCCVKCCCQSSPSKTDSPGPNAESPDSHTATDHEHTTEPTRPRYNNPSQSYGTAHQPSHTSAGPTAHNPDSRFQKMPARGPHGAAPSASLGSGCLSSDPEPRFELKGLDFPSAAPLSSDSTYCSVYTSDKLNFL